MYHGISVLSSFSSSFIRDSFLVLEFVVDMMVLWSSCLALSGGRKLVIPDRKC